MLTNFNKGVAPQVCEIKFATKFHSILYIKTPYPIKTGALKTTLLRLTFT